MFNFQKFFKIWRCTLQPGFAEGNQLTVVKGWISFDIKPLSACHMTVSRTTEVLQYNHFGHWNIDLHCMSYQTYIKNKVKQLMWYDDQVTDSVAIDVRCSSRDNLASQNYCRELTKCYTEATGSKAFIEVFWSSFTSHPRNVFSSEVHELKNQSQSSQRTLAF